MLFKRAIVSEMERMAASRLPRPAVCGATLLHRTMRMVPMAVGFKQGSNYSAAKRSEYRCPDSFSLGRNPRICAARLSFNQTVRFQRPVGGCEPFGARCGAALAALIERQL